MREEEGKVGDIRWLLAGCVSTSSNVQARTQEALPKVCHALEGSKDLFLYQFVS